MNPRLKVLALGLTIGSLLATAPIRAAAPAPQQPAQSASIQAPQITIPVNVTGPDGKFVSGLTIADFSLGTSFATLIAVKEVEALTATDGKTTPVYFIYDAISVPPPPQSAISREVLDMLQQIADKREPTAVLLNTRHGLNVVYDLNTDPAVLAAALKRRGAQIFPDAAFAAKVADTRKRLKPLDSEIENYGYAWLAPNLSRTYDQLSALRQFARAMSRIPQRKALVWFTDQFDMQVKGGGLYLFGGPGPEEFTGPKVDDSPGWAKVATDYPAVLQELNDARVSIFPMMVGFDERGNYHPRLASLAEHTGGSVIPSIADLRGRFGAYYLLTVTPTSEAKRPSWYKLKIQSSRHGVHLIAPEWYFAPK